MTVKHSVHIEAPVEKVFNFFRDPMNWQELALEGITLKDVKLTREGVGTHFSWVAKVAGIHVEGFDVFTEFIPNQRITDKSSRSFEGTWTYSFEPEGSGTKFTMENHPRSLWRIPVLNKLGEGRHDRVFSLLKAKMEA